MLKIYSVYPDSVNITNKNISPILMLSSYLKKIKELGFNCVHVLPFLKSPGLDKGFDVSDYYSVNESYGTFQDLKTLIHNAKSLNLKLIMDLVFNHVSVEHEWFKKAISGDEYYVNYFIHSKTKPIYLYKKKNYAFYMVKKNKLKKIQILLPEKNNEIPHWIKKNNIWYYHSFYSHQIDLNWSNKNLIIEMKKILIYWSELGFNFRFDAASFLGSEPYKTQDSFNEENLNIFIDFKSEIKKYNLNCIFILETCQNLDIVEKYFDNKCIDYIYNFKLCSDIWKSVIKQDITDIHNNFLHTYVYGKIKMVNFIRNHDELYLFGDDTKLIYKTLVDRQNNKKLRKNNGISGTTCSLLDNDYKTFQLINLLLVLLPGDCLMIFSGDEIAKKNTEDLLYFTKDTRYLHRGSIFYDNIKNKYPEKINNDISEYIKSILSLNLNFNYENVMIKNNQTFLFFIKSENYLVYMNFSSFKKYKIILTVDIQKILFNLNDCIFNFDNNKLTVPKLGCIIFMYSKLS